MRVIQPTPALALATLLLLLAPASASSGTVTGTTSTGQTDAWGLDNVAPCDPKAATDCLLDMCPRDIFTRIVTLRLIDPSPGDAVALTVVGDGPGQQMTFADPTGTVTLYPSDVATYDDPVARVGVQLGGCNRTTTALVTGILVDGETPYELTY